MATLKLDVCYDDHEGLEAALDELTFCLRVRVKPTGENWNGWPEVEFKGRRKALRVVANRYVRHDNFATLAEVVALIK